MVLFRRLLGDVLRSRRMDQGRTLRDHGSLLVGRGCLSTLRERRADADQSPRRMEPIRSVSPLAHPEPGRDCPAVRGSA